MNPRDAMRSLVVIAAAVLLLAGCGGGSSPSAAANSSGSSSQAGSAGKVQSAHSLRPRRVFEGAVRNVVLVHGAYADGSFWSEVIKRLQAAGVTATACRTR